MRSPSAGMVGLFLVGVPCVGSWKKKSLGSKELQGAVYMT